VTAGERRERRVSRGRGRRDASNRNKTRNDERLTLLVSSISVLLLDESDESVVDSHSVGKEEGRSGTELVEHEELLLL